MAKKFSLLLAAVAVVAFAVPAFASASSVTLPAGTLLGVNSIVTGTSTNTITETASLGTLECATVTVNGKLTVNNGSTVEAVKSGEAVTTECFDEGEPIKITDPTMLNLKSSTSGKGTVSLTFIADLPAGIVCHFEGTAVPFTYTPGTTGPIHVSGGLVATPEVCGGSKITGDFAITSGGNAVTLD